METYDVKFAAFIDILRKTDSTLVTDKSTPVLKASLLAAKFDQVAEFRVQHKKKRLNGYNLFMRERMSVLKDNETDSNKRMLQISTEWNQLSDAQKVEWKEKAHVISETPVKPQTKTKTKNKTPKWSGYQMYVVENMTKLTDIKPKERMKTIGDQWKKLTDEQKAPYKVAATTKTLEVQKLTEESPPLQEIQKLTEESPPLQEIQKLTEETTPLHEIQKLTEESPPLQEIQN